MTTELASRPTAADAIRKLERVVLHGDLSPLSDEERVAYYARVAQSLGLNPLTKPFDYVQMKQGLVLYVKKEATDQLRDIHGVNVDKIERELDEALGTYIVTVYGHDRYGRTDSSIGVVAIKGLTGEALANAMMKAETKGKRRMTLSICGLGWMDELEAKDAKAAEVMPRQALAGTIASRTAALTAAADEGEDNGGASPSAGAEASVTRETGAASPADESGFLQRAIPAGAVSPVKPRKARKAEPKQPGDEGYGSARAHAMAAERGLDHEAVRRIAAEVLAVKDRDGFSLAMVTETDWTDVIAAIGESPATKDDVPAAEAFVAASALVADLTKDETNPWNDLDPVIAEMFGKGRDEALTVPELIELGIRIVARNPLP